VNAAAPSSRSSVAFALRTAFLPLVTAFGLLAAFRAGAVEPAARPVVRFGVIAEQLNEPDRMLRVYAEFLRELKARLAPKGVDVASLVIAQDLADLSHRIARGEVDFVAETVFVTLDLQAEDEGSLVPSLAIVRRNQREYHSVFFALKDGKVRRLEDLRGRMLVLQADRSTSAFAVPRAELAMRGIKSVPAGQPAAPRGSVFYAFAGAELNQAIWVLKGRGDAGAFNEGDWAALPRKLRDGLVVFHETKPLLRGIVSFRRGMETGTRSACEQVLVDMSKDPAGAAALGKTASINRFERLDPRDLAGLGEWRRALKSAGIR
jgi:phosphonate transport system substrate-binding protein